MSDEGKTREELLEELRALRARLRQGEGAASDDLAARPKEGWTRREALGAAAWVAPVVFSVSLTGSPARGQTGGGFVSTPVPTDFPESFRTAPPSTPPPEIFSDGFESGNTNEWSQTAKSDQKRDADDPRRGVELVPKLK
jgi:hypothetical protein